MARPGAGSLQFGRRVGMAAAAVMRYLAVRGLQQQGSGCLAYVRQAVALSRGLGLAAIAIACLSLAIPVKSWGEDQISMPIHKAAKLEVDQPRSSERIFEAQLPDNVEASFALLERWSDHLTLFNWDIEFAPVINRRPVGQQYSIREASMPPWDWQFVAGRDEWVDPNGNPVGRSSSGILKAQHIVSGIALERQFLRLHGDIGARLNLGGDLSVLGGAGRAFGRDGKFFIGEDHSVDLLSGGFHLGQLALHNVGLPLDHFISAMHRGQLAIDDVESVCANCHPNGSENNYPTLEVGHSPRVDWGWLVALFGGCIAVSGVFVGIRASTILGVAIGSGACFILGYGLVVWGSTLFWDDAFNRPTRPSCVQHARPATLPALSEISITTPSVNKGKASNVM